MIAYEMMREKSWTALLSPLAVLIPVITFLELSRRTRFRPALGAHRFLATTRNLANVPAGYPCRNLRLEDCRMTVATSSLEPDRIERSPADAPRPSLARAALVSHPDDFDDADGRRMALVRARPDPARLRRRTPLRRHRRGHVSAVVGILLFRALKQTSRRKRPCEIEPHCWS